MIRPNDAADLRGLDIFSGMAESNFEALLRGAYFQIFPAGVDLIVEGDPSDFLYVVLEGAVELFASWSGRETTMATVHPVSTFILAASIRDAPYLMSARTIEKCRIVLLPSSDVRAVFGQDTAFAHAVVMELSQCYRALVKATKDLKLRNSLERLANYLLRQNRRSGGSGMFELRTEKRRLASYLGMTPENLSRAFRTLEPYGVEVNGNQITLTKIGDLTILAKPSPLIDDFSR